MLRRVRRLLLALVVVLASAACGADAGDETAEDGEVTPEGAAGVEVTGPPGEKPEIRVPAGPPPDDLIVHDLVEGDGAVAEPGATVTTHYVGVLWDTGEQFDASWDAAAPVQFPLSGVIEGWQEGIPGMNVGGRRLLVVPPELAYGERPPPGIPPGATLVFVVDLVATP